jgi:hypothetical protein
MWVKECPFILKLSSLWLPLQGSINELYPDGTDNISDFKTLVRSKTPRRRQMEWRINQMNMLPSVVPHTLLKICYKYRCITRLQIFFALLHFGFSERHWWRSQPSGRWCGVDRSIGHNVSEKQTNCTFRVVQDERSWRLKALPKRCYIHTNIHGFTSQTTGIFVWNLSRINESANAINSKRPMQTAQRCYAGPWRNASPKTEHLRHEQIGDLENTA